MNNTKNLEEIINGLILSKKEGDFWDFKLKHHENNTKLVHDIICMANLACHEGDRYIVFGVEDGFYEIKGLTTEQSKSQANIIDLLRKVPFANNSYPDIYLETIVLERKKLDVLIIKDRSEKPYYLSNKYQKDNDKALVAGTVSGQLHEMYNHKISYHK